MASTDLINHIVNFGQYRSIHNSGHCVCMSVFESVCYMPPSFFHAAISPPPPPPRTKKSRAGRAAEDQRGEQKQYVSEILGVSCKPSAGYCVTYLFFCNLPMCVCVCVGHAHMHTYAGNI